MDFLKIWFGRSIPKAIVDRINDETEKLPADSKLTLLVNHDITMHESIDGLSDKVEVDLVERYLKPNDADQHSQFLIQTILDLIQIGKQKGSAIPYGLASDIARWLPCYLTVPNKPGRFKVYTDTDIVIDNSFYQLGLVLATSPILIEMRGPKGKGNGALDCGFIQLPYQSDLPQLISTAYYQIMQGFADEQALTELVSTADCGGILLLRESGLLEKTAPFLHGSPLAKAELEVHDACTVYHPFVRDLNERSWLLEEKIQGHIYNGMNEEYEMVTSTSGLSTRENSILSAIASFRALANNTSFRQASRHASFFARTASDNQPLTSGSSLKSLTEDSAAEAIANADTTSHNAANTSDNQQTTTKKHIPQHYAGIPIIVIEEEDKAAAQLMPSATCASRLI